MESIKTLNQFEMLRASLDEFEAEMKRRENFEIRT